MKYWLALLALLLLLPFVLAVSNSPIVVTPSAFYTNNSTSATQPFTFYFNEVENATAVCNLTVNGTITAFNGTVYNFTNTTFFSNTSFVEGNNTWVISCLNTTSAQTAGVLRTDNLAPQITIVAPANATTNTTPSLNATFDDWAEFSWFSINTTLNGTYYLNKSNITTGLNPLASGLYNLTVYGNNTFNTSNSTTVWFTVDTAIPQVLLNSPANNTELLSPSMNSTINFNFSYTDAFSTTTNCSLYIDSELDTSNATTQNNTATVFAPASDDAVGFSHTWFVRCNDTVNTNTSETRTFIFNSTTAMNNFTNASVYGGTNSTIPINFTFSSLPFATASCSVLVDNNVVAYNATVLNNTYAVNYSNTSYTESFHSLRVNCTNGTVSSATQLLGFYVDNVASTFTALSPANNTAQGNRPNTTITVTDTSPTLTCRYYVNNIPVNQTAVSQGVSTAIISNTTFAEGYYPWYVNCTDGAVNTTQSEIRNVTVGAQAGAAHTGATTLNAGQVNRTMTINITNTGAFNITQINGTIPTLTVAGASSSNGWSWVVPNNGSTFGAMNTTAPLVPGNSTILTLIVTGLNPATGLNTTAGNYNITLSVTNGTIAVPLTPLGISVNLPTVLTVTYDGIPCASPPCAVTAAGYNIRFRVQNGANSNYSSSLNTNFTLAKISGGAACTVGTPTVSVGTLGGGSIYTNTWAINSCANGTFNFEATAIGKDANTVATVNSNLGTVAVTVTIGGGTGGSTGGGAAPPQASVPSMDLTIDPTNLKIERGKSANVTLSVKSTGNTTLGTVTISHDATPSCCSIAPDTCTLTSIAANATKSCTILVTTKSGYSLKDYLVTYTAALDDGVTKSVKTLTISLLQENYTSTTTTAAANLTSNETEVLLNSTIAKLLETNSTIEEIRDKGLNSTIADDLMGQAKELLAQAQIAYAEGNLAQAADLASRAEQLMAQARSAALAEQEVKKVGKLDLGGYLQLGGMLLVAALIMTGIFYVLPGTLQRAVSGDTGAISTLLKRFKLDKSPYMEHFGPQPKKEDTLQRLSKFLEPEKPKEPPKTGTKSLSDILMGK